jgi:hypothetical protein
MKRLSENVFEFNFPFWGALDTATAGFAFFFRYGFYLLTPLFFLLGFGATGSNKVGYFIIGIFCMPLTIWWKTLLKFNHYSGGYLIMDNDHRIINFYKWGWNFKKNPKKEELAIAEIKSLATDIDETTETKYVPTGPSYTNEGKFKTNTSRKYVLVLHGKFGSKRINFKNIDDLNLFQTLLSEDRDTRVVQ